MSVHMKREVERLKQMLLTLCSLVEEQLWQAVKAIEKRDGEMARQVIQRDWQVDQMEVDIEEECLKILALYQPVAIDLRYIITALKINNDLERIGDLSVNIAERAEYLAGHDPVDAPLDFETMAEKTQVMVHLSIDALVNMDCHLAHQVCKSDDQVDQIHKTMYDQVHQSILKHPEQIESLTHLLSASRHLERIADHATNIAEDVIYMAEGRIIRHRKEKSPEQ